MSRKDTDKRRKLNEWKVNERARAEAALPAPKQALLGLFDELDKRISETPCDHTLRFTMEWADKSGLDRKTLSDWLQENGGFCDCEVLANVPDSNTAFQD